MIKEKIAIIIGGQSTEHQVSLISGKSIIENIDRTKYSPVIIGIDQTGAWHYFPGEEYLSEADTVDKVSLNLDFAQDIRIDFTGKVLLSRGEKIDVDVFFPVLHGKNGEDGTIQGLFELLGISYVGCGVLGSATCMDKDVAKRLLDRGGIKNANFITLRVGDEFDLDEIVSNLGLPMFVKAANGGSSVGVSKVSEADQLLSAIEDAFQYDNKVILEEMIVGRELECAVLGNENAEASIVLGEILPYKEEYYSYEAKYINDDGVKLLAPAIVDEQTLGMIRSIALRTYHCLECRGLSRIDFFLTEAGEIVVNEVNTLPGFTSISMYPRLWQESGLSYCDLITQLIVFAQGKEPR